MSLEKDHELQVKSGQREENVIQMQIRAEQQSEAYVLTTLQRREKLKLLILEHYIDEHVSVQPDENRKNVLLIRGLGKNHEVGADITLSPNANEYGILMRYPEPSAPTPEERAEDLLGILKGQGLDPQKVSVYMPEATAEQQQALSNVGLKLVDAQPFNQLLNNRQEKMAQTPGYTSPRPTPPGVSQ
ncbi:MAG: hypothetical protein ACE365_01240 [Gammaproteobacteria bacterium]